MKLDAKNSPRALQMPRSAARQAMLLLMFLALFAAGSFRAAAAGTPIEQIDQLAAQENISAGDYSSAVADIVKHNTDDATTLISEAVKGKPPFACDVVKACILALMPANGNIDPQLVATIVADIVRTIQKSNPEVVRQVISCAVEVDRDAAPAILNALAGVFGGPGGVNRPGDTHGGQVPAGNGNNPAISPTPTPPVTPPPVTPVQNP